MFTITLITVVWLIISLIILISLIFMNIKFLSQNRKTRKALKSYVGYMEKRTTEKYNKISSMNVVDLNNYLRTIFSRLLEATSVSDISENDPKAHILLYEKTLINFIKYLGNETIDSINFYYGDNYVVKWCELEYKLMENRGTLPKIISKDIYSNTIKDSIK